MQMGCFRAAMVENGPSKQAHSEVYDLWAKFSFLMNHLFVTQPVQQKCLANLGNLQHACLFWKEQDFQAKAPQ